MSIINERWCGDVRADVWRFVGRATGGGARTAVVVFGVRALRRTADRQTFARLSRVDDNNIIYTRRNIIIA